MGLSLNDLKQRNCANFLEQLFQLEENLETDGFSNSLDGLHHSFLTLCECFGIRPCDEKISFQEADKNGISKIKVNQLILHVYNGLVIDIDDKYSELSSLFVGKSEKEAIDAAKLYFDYDSRSCDFCGLYLHKPEFQTPVGREKMVDFVMAYHPKCYKD